MLFLLFIHIFFLILNFFFPFHPHFYTTVKMLETLPTHRNLVRYLFHETSASTLRLFMRRYYGNLNKYLEKKEELEEVLSLKEMISIG